MSFETGERVTYYPIKKNELDNRHWPADVVGKSPSGRIRVEIHMPEGTKRRSVSGRRLARQRELIE